MSDFNSYFKQRRIALGYTARKFAQAKGYDVAYISRLENGIILPPAEREKVEALAKALELEKGTKEWGDFIDMVAIARNEIPEDLRSNDVALRVLPAFYRGVRNKTLSEKEVDKLIGLFEEARKEE